MGESKFSIEKFLSDSAEKVRRANFWGVTKFGYRKVFCFRGLRLKPFCAVFQKISGSQKFIDKKGGTKIFRRKFFVSQ